MESMSNNCKNRGLSMACTPLAVRGNRAIPSSSSESAKSSNTSCSEDWSHSSGSLRSATDQELHYTCLNCKVNAIQSSELLVSREEDGQS